MWVNIVVGVAFVVAMTFLARTEISWLNGILPLFPTFALIGQASTYAAKGDTAAKDVALVGLPTLIPYAVYLLVIALLSERIGFPKSAVVGVGLWGVCTALIVAVKTGRIFS